MDILLCQPGESVAVVPEPTNKVDRNAIAVYSGRGVQIGYSPADRTIIVCSAVEDGSEVRGETSS